MRKYNDKTKKTMVIILISFVGIIVIFSLFLKKAIDVGKTAYKIASSSVLFDKDMQKEYIFCSYLLKLLPAEPVHMIDLEGALKLEFYKLEQTFKGDIGLIDQAGEYEPAKGKGKAVPEQKEPLEEVIQKINDLFAGNFTEADRVILHALHDKLKADEKLQRVARTSDPKIFTQSIFPKAFDDVAQDSYVEHTETSSLLSEAYSSLFQNKSKYNAFMSALASMLYKEFNRSRL